MTDEVFVCARALEFSYQRGHFHEIDEEGRPLCGRQTEFERVSRERAAEESTGQCSHCALCLDANDQNTRRRLTFQRELPGVGPKQSRKLLEAGYETISDLEGTTLSELMGVLNAGTAARLHGFLEDDSRDEKWKRGELVPDGGMEVTALPYACRVCETETDVHVRVIEHDEARWIDVHNQRLWAGHCEVCDQERTHGLAFPDAVDAPHAGPPIARLPGAERDRRLVTDGGTDQEEAPCECSLKTEHAPDVDECREEHEPTALVCSRPDGHDGSHAACSVAEHPAVVWEPSDDAPQLVTDGGRPGRGNRSDDARTDGGRISSDDLTDEQIERVINSRGFQKMLAYSKLADGIQVLEQEDEIFDSMVSAILKQHSSIKSESSIREVLELFQQEVATFTEPLVSADGEEVDAADLEDVFIDEGGENDV